VNCSNAEAITKCLRHIGQRGESNFVLSNAGLFLDWNMFAVRDVGAAAFALDIELTDAKKGHGTRNGFLGCRRDLVPHLHCSG